MRPRLLILSNYSQVKHSLNLSPAQCPVQYYQERNEETFLELKRGTRKVWPSDKRKNFFLAVYQILTVSIANAPRVKQKFS